MCCTMPLIPSATAVCQRIPPFHGATPYGNGCSSLFWGHSPSSGDWECCCIMSRSAHVGLSRNRQRRSLPMATAIDRFDEKARRTFDSIGRTEVYRGELLRHPVYTRVLHWMVALFFFLALFPGFGIYLPWLFRWFTPIFGGGARARELHPWFGVGFVTFFSLQVLNWIDPMKWTGADSRWMRNLRKIAGGKEKMEPPDTGFFNAGQKAQFWEIVVGSVVFLITVIILW